MKKQKPLRKEFNFVVGVWMGVSVPARTQEEAERKLVNEFNPFTRRRWVDGVNDYQYFNEDGEDLLIKAEKDGKKA